ncbi:Cell division protein FtsI/penicillin-binding protein 2 [Clostridium sp. USBA 49]|jgi:cell division protein FtsI/penicillin-binding protein 2|uniref:penicillin-binding transpeptidase domain-containing protein n=1 Tax=Clostridium TaxID=1485 RepID=UPI000999285A|nr:MULTISPECIES: penicillin-binding transpeptidase domain-containing protein [Clostridium]SKA76008.1 Cell division protein FtsI/penicillin-binding protein 2 [Clostridium sp. USBA 49]
MRDKIQKKRIIIFIVSIFLIFVIIWWRIKILMVDEAYKLSVWADSQYTDKIPKSDLNYRLFDKNGKELLKYKNKYYAVIDTSAFIKNNMGTKSDDLYALIYILRNYDNSYDLSKVGLNGTSKKLTYEIDEITYNKLKNIKDVKGFYTYSTSVVDRSEAWKIENMIINPRNQVDNKLKSKDSLEMIVYNKTKLNQYPTINFVKDINGNVSLGEFITPENNTNLRLTLDKNIQDNIKEILKDDKYKKHEQIGVILSESNSGKILAMTQKDDTKPNVNLGSTTQNGFEPGSIFKIIVEEAGLERNSINLGEKYSCKQNIYNIDEKKDHGILDPEEALIVSCNNIFAQIGDKVGVNNIIAEAQSQGIFSKVLGFDSEVTGDYVMPKLPGEGAGQLAIGQSMRITPIQAVGIVNTVVNNGIYVKPYIVEAYVGDNNEVKELLKTEEYSTLKKSTANSLKNQMIKVVRRGTGVEADIKNIEIGGKTGTSTRIDGNKKTSDGWFIGFFKVKNKYYSMVVFVKDIDNKNEQAANTAVPIFKDIVLSIYDYLKK